MDDATASAAAAAAPPAGATGIVRALPTLPSNANIVKTGYKEAAYFILHAVKDNDAHLPNSRAYGQVIAQLFREKKDPTDPIPTFLGQFSRWSSVTQDRRNIKERAEHIIATFHNISNPKVHFPTSLQYLANQLHEEMTTAAKGNADARQEKENQAATNLQREGELGMTSGGRGTGVPSVAGASKEQHRQMQAAAAALSQNPVSSNRRASKKRGDDIEEILDSDDEKMLEEEEDEDAAFYHLDPAYVAHGFGFDANANGPPPPVPALPHVPGTVPPLQPLLGTANSQTIGH
jgi:hypothetical protein